MAGLNAVEGAVFALVGLLLAFAISGALQRFDERKQLVLQEANAISSAYDRLDLLESEARLKLKKKFKEYVKARVDLYRMPIEFALWTGSEVTSAEQQAKILKLKAEIWDEAVEACPPASSRNACPLVLPSLNSAFEVARLRNGANRDTRRKLFISCSSASASGVPFSRVSAWPRPEPKAGCIW